MSDDLLFIAQVCAPRCDVAFDRTHDDWPRLSTLYARSRAPVRLDALPRRGGDGGRPEPRLWAVGWLTPAAYAHLRSYKNLAELQQMAFRVGCLARREPDGSLIRAQLAEKKTTAAGSSVASEAWLAEAVRLGGHQLIAEVAEVILRRHEIGDVPDDGGDDLSDPLDRYQIPAGIALAR